MKMMMKRIYVNLDEDKQKCWSQGFKESNPIYYDIFYYSKLWNGSYCQSYTSIDSFKYWIMKMIMKASYPESQSWSFKIAIAANSSVARVICSCSHCWRTGWKWHTSEKGCSKSWSSDIIFCEKSLDDWIFLIWKWYLKYVKEDLYQELILGIIVLRLTLIHRWVGSTGLIL
jgi:hypothetical protein